MKCLHLTTAGLLLAAPFACAAALTTAAPTEPVVKQMDFLQVLAKGGPMMFPLGIMSIIMVLLILLFLLTIRRNVIASDRFMNAAETMIRKRDYLALITYSHRRNECIARITQKTLEFMAGNPGIPFENIRDAAQTEGSRQAGMLTSRITYLADIGSIAPMIGLLGTVIGMIKAFIEISQGEVQGVRQMGLAQGVSEALIATACGLAISIVALASYSFFRGRVQKYIGELEAAATHLVALIHGQVEKQTLSRMRDDAPMPTLLGGGRQDLHGI